MKKKIKKRKDERILDPEQTWNYQSYVGMSDSNSKTWLQSSPNYSIADIKDLLQDDFWLRACINTIVDEVVKYPLKAQIASDVKSNQYLERLVKQIDGFLKYPNYKEPLFVLRKKYLKDMLIYGNGVCVIDYKGDTPSQLRAVPGYTLGVTDKEPPTYVFCKTKDTNTLLTDKNGKTIELTQKQVMHFQIEADSDGLVADTPLNPLYYHFGTDIELIKRVMLTAKKGGRMPAILSTDNKTATDPFKKMLRWMNSQLENGSTLIGLNKKFTVTELPNWSATDILNIFKWMGMVIATIYKIPPFMLNLVENTGSLNAREQYSRFLENVIEPILKYEAYIYTLNLVKRGFNTANIEITTPMVATKLNYSRARIARLLSNKDQEILSVEEIRKLIFGL